MSFQAYLDNIEKKTGLIPQQLLDEAAAKGFGPQTKAGVVIEWLAADHDLGRGHAMAIYHVIKNGPVIGAEHVGTGGTHRDESIELRLDGLAARITDASTK